LDWRDKDQDWGDDPRTHNPTAASGDTTRDEVASRKSALI